MSSQPRLIEPPPTRCCFLDLASGQCQKPPRWVLHPGNTGHCEEHSVHSVITRNPAWQQATASGSAWFERLGDS